MNRGKWILKWVVFGLFAVALFGLVTMLLWNWLVPALFNGPVISFWQTLGLLLLIKILFWGIGGKSHCHHAGGHWQGGHWKFRLHEKFSTMTPEEREAFKKKMKEKWCRYESGSSDENSGTSNV